MLNRSSKMKNEMYVLISIAYRGLSSYSLCEGDVDYPFPTSVKERCLQSAIRMEGTVIEKETPIQSIHEEVDGSPISLALESFGSTDERVQVLLRFL